MNKGNGVNLTLLSIATLFLAFATSGCFNFNSIQELKRYLEGKPQESSANTSATTPTSGYSYSPQGGIISTPSGQFTFTFPIKVNAEFTNLNTVLDPEKMQTILLANIYIENKFNLLPVTYGVILTGLPISAVINKSFFLSLHEIRSMENRIIKVEANVSNLLPQQSVNYYLIFTEPFSFTVFPDGNYTPEISYDIKLSSAKMSGGYLYLTFSTQKQPFAIFLVADNIEKCIPLNGIYDFSLVLNGTNAKVYKVYADQNFEIVCTPSSLDRVTKITGAMSYKVLLGSQIINCECNATSVTTIGESYLNSDAELAAERLAFITGTKFGQLSGIQILNYSYDYSNEKLTNLKVVLFNPYPTAITTPSNKCCELNQSNAEICTNNTQITLEPYEAKTVTLSCSGTVNPNEDVKLCVYSQNGGINCVLFKP